MAGEQAIGIGAAWLQAIGDLLTFRTFITPSVLVATYYVGAVSVPLFAWLLARRVVTALEARGERWPASSRGLRAGARARTGALAGLLFVALELGWRMLFEFLLAYFQMREALVRPGT
jgi:hypothetical protein